MMSAPPASIEMTFVPLQLIQIQIGKATVYVYPVVTPNMPIFERAHAFQVVKTATENLPVDMRLIFDAIGTQLNCSAIVDGLLYDWRQTFDDGWYDFANLSIISFHDSAGAQINNTTVAGTPAILLDVLNGNLSNCRQQDVRFVRVSCSIDFAPLFTLRNPGNTILRVGFYLELPQTTVAMTNGAGVAYNLTTWHGAADLSTLTRDKVRALILEPSMQTGPIALSPANFNLGEANTESNKLLASIHAKIWQLGWKQIMASIFSQLCPGYSDQPHAVLDHIKQSSVGADGQVVTTSASRMPPDPSPRRRSIPSASAIVSSRAWIVICCHRFAKITLTIPWRTTYHLRISAASFPSSSRPPKPPKTSAIRSKKSLARL